MKMTAIRKPSFRIEDILSKDYKSTDNNNITQIAANRDNNYLCNSLLLKRPLPTMRSLINHNNDSAMSVIRNNGYMCCNKVNSRMDQDSGAEFLQHCRTRLQNPATWHSNNGHYPPLIETYLPYGESVLLTDGSPTHEASRFWPTHPYAMPVGEYFSTGYGIPCGNAKRKGGQVRFTPMQTQALEHRFNSHKYLSPEDRHRLADLLKLTDRQVKTWFQNRRAKWRRINQSSADTDDIISSKQNNLIVDIESDDVFENPFKS